MSTTMIAEAKRLLDIGAAKNAWMLFEVNVEANIPSHIGSCLRWAWALEKMGCIDEALARIEAWISADTQNASIPYVLRAASFLLEQLGRPYAAMRYLQMAKANLPNPDPKTEEAILRITSNTRQYPRPSAGTIPGNNQFPVQPDREIVAEAFSKTSKFGIKIPQLFTDWSDKLAFYLWIIQIASLMQFLVRPNWKNIDSHPTFAFLKGYSNMCI